MSGSSRKTSLRLLISGFSTVLLIFLAGCMMPQKESPKAATYEGPPTSIGQGSARSFVTLDADGKPSTIGIRLSKSALDGLPAEEPTDAIEWEYTLQLPPEAASSGYNHIGIDWNPHGHIPKGIYDKPHFDFHFYLIDDAARNKITAVGDDLAQAHKAPPAEFMPAGYVLPPGTEVPHMGAHAVDPKADEFTGKPFTKTFIYGYYGGKMIFLEPMVTKAFLETKPDALVTVAVPKKYSLHGYYPTQYGVKYDQAHGEYVISLANLVPH